MSQSAPVKQAQHKRSSSQAATDSVAEQSFKTLTYMEAIIEAQIEELNRDENVVLIGEDLAIYGDGKVMESFGESRIWCAPISENSFCGVAVGAPDVRGSIAPLEQEMSTDAHVVGDSRRCSVGLPLRAGVLRARYGEVGAHTSNRKCPEQYHAREETVPSIGD